MSLVYYYFFFTNERDFECHKAISYLIECSWPDEPMINEFICFCLLNSHPSTKLYYFNEIGERVNKNYISDSLYAMLHDKIYTENGIPQIYGTQSHGRPEYGIHTIRDSLNVNKRRKEVGLSKIENQKQFWSTLIN